MSNNLKTVRVFISSTFRDIPSKRETQIRHNNPHRSDKSC
jgi:hypothetical protein